MQAMRASRCLPKLSWEANVTVRSVAPTVSAAWTTRNASDGKSALQQQQRGEASSVSTSTPPHHGLGRAVRQLIAASRTTPSHHSLTPSNWRASASPRLDCMLRDGTGTCRNNSSGLVTATGGAAALLSQGAIIGRGSSATKELTAAATPARRNMSSSTMSEREFHLIADEALEDIHDAVEEALEDGFTEEFDCNMSQGVLNIVVGDRGTWVLNKQSPNRQIWWSSPISGPMRFEYHDDARRWLNTRDGETELRDLLAKEMDEKCGVSLF